MIEWLLIAIHIINFWYTLVIWIKINIIDLKPCNLNLLILSRKTLQWILVKHAFLRIEWWMIIIIVLHLLWHIFRIPLICLVFIYRIGISRRPNKTLFIIRVILKFICVIGILVRCGSSSKFWIRDIINCLTWIICLVRQIALFHDIPSVIWIIILGDIIIFFIQHCPFIICSLGINILFTFLFFLLGIVACTHRRILITHFILFNNSI